jgi:hypothetical protein
MPDLATERALLGRVIRVVLAQLEDPQTTDAIALEQFVHFIGGCEFYLANVALVAPAIIEPMLVEAA